MRTWLRRLIYLLRQSQHEADLRDEIEAHRALRAADLERAGLTPHEAAAASRKAVGNVLLARDDARQVWLGSWDTWSQDIRYGLRTLHRNPAVSTVAVLTLALGLGVNAGIFTVVNAVLFRDVPASRPHELVSVSQSVAGIQEYVGDDRFSTSDYFAYRDGTRTLSRLAAYGNARGEATLGGDVPRKVLGMLVSCNYFDVLEQPPALGRPLAPGDCEPGADLVIVLSHQLWKTAFAGDPSIVGRAIRLNRQQVTVAGVASESTYDGSPFLAGGYFAPLTAGRAIAPDDSRYDSPDMPWLSTLGRRRDGVGLEQVRADLGIVSAQIDRQRPGRATSLSVERATAGLRGRLRDTARGAAAVVMAAFGVILLIACANVANLLLARGMSRTQEIAIRSSLGASRARVVRQLVTESLLLALAGGLLGTIVALWSFEALIALAVPALLPPWLPLTLIADLAPDTGVLTFARVLTAGSGILCGLAPALSLATPDVHALMKQGAGAGGRRGRRARATLVGVQVALCMVLTIAAGLLLRGLYATYTIDPGFAYRDITYLSLESVFDGYSPAQSGEMRARLVNRLEVIPGVEAVASALQEPLGDDEAPVEIRLPGETEGQSRIGEIDIVSDNYFAVLERPIVRGRSFTQEEVGAQAPGPRPAILTETTARNLWPDRDPIGRMLLAGADTLVVVGISADAQVTSLGAIDPYYVYVPGEGSVLLVKSRADSDATISAIHAAARALDPTLVLTALPLEATIGWSRGISGTATAVFAGLGVLALVLAAVGIYGVVSYAVAGRYREIGVRLALGATVWNVLRLILAQTMRPVAVGAAIGVGAAVATSRVLTSVLFGVSPTDAIGLAGAVAVVLGAALVSGMIAARPVVGADATRALRYE